MLLFPLYLVLAAALVSQTETWRAVSGSLVTSSFHSSRVIDQVTEDDLFDFTVIIWSPISGRPCSGVLVAEQWVLTAGHCNVDETFRVFVRKEAIVDDSGEKLEKRASYAISEVSRHPEYEKIPGTEDLFLNDLALVHVAEPVKNIEPVYVTDEEVNFNDDTKLYQSGYYIDRIRKDPFVFRSNEVRALSPDSCKELFENAPLRGKETVLSAYDENKEILLCAEFEEIGKGVLAGESGGPLVARAEEGWYVVVGIASIAPLHESDKLKGLRLPDFYVAISAYKEFIEDTTNEEVKFSSIK